MNSTRGAPLVHRSGPEFPSALGLCLAKESMDTVDSAHLAPICPVENPCPGLFRCVEGSPPMPEPTGTGSPVSSHSSMRLDILECTLSQGTMPLLSAPV